MEQTIGSHESEDASELDGQDARNDSSKSPRNRSMMQPSQWPESKALSTFRARIASIHELVFISPFDLDIVREISDRAVAVITEEARWFSPDADESVGCVVKTYRPGIISSSKALDELIEECRMIHALDHRRAKILFRCSPYHINLPSNMQAHDKDARSRMLQLPQQTSHPRLPLCRRGVWGHLVIV